MKKLIYILLVGLLASWTSLQGQSTVDFFADHVKVLPNNQITVDIRVKDFTNVVSTSFTLSWDTTIIRYISASNTGLAGAPARPETYPSSMTYLWLDFDLSGEDLADSTSILSVTFQAIGTPGSVSPLTFGSTPTAMDVAFAPLTPGLFNNTAGSVTIDITFPVELSYFKAQSVGNEGVELAWRTEQEIGNSHFEIQRSVDAEFFESIGIRRGIGISDSPTDYQFVDNNAPAGKLYYRLKQIDFDGSAIYSPQVEVFMQPTELVLRNFPNPFSEHTTLKFTLPEPTHYVQVKLVDLEGRVLWEESYREEFAPGSHTRDLHLPNLAPGLYFCQVEGESFRGSLRMAILR